MNMSSRSQSPEGLNDDHRAFTNDERKRKRAEEDVGTGPSVSHRGATNQGIPSTMETCLDEVRHRLAQAQAALVKLSQCRMTTRKTSSASSVVEEEVREDRVVLFNVGGKPFSIAQETLEKKEPNSLLSLLGQTWIAERKVHRSSLVLKERQQKALTAEKEVDNDEEDGRKSITPLPTPSAATPVVAFNDGRTTATTTQNVASTTTGGTLSVSATTISTATTHDQTNLSSSSAVHHSPMMPPAAMLAGGRGSSGIIADAAEPTRNLSGGGGGGGGPYFPSPFALPFSVPSAAAAALHQHTTMQDALNDRSPAGNKTPDAPAPPPQAPLPPEYHTIPVDDDGRIFIDRCPTIFGCLLNMLRGYKNKVEPCLYIPALIDAKFFGVLKTFRLVHPLPEVSPTFQTVAEALNEWREFRDVHGLGDSTASLGGHDAAGSKSTHRASEPSTSNAATAAQRKALRSAVADGVTESTHKLEVVGSIHTFCGPTASIQSPIGAESLKRSQKAAEKITVRLQVMALEQLVVGVVPSNVLEMYDRSFARGMDLSFVLNANKTTAANIRLPSNFFSASTPKSLSRIVEETHFTPIMWPNTSLLYASGNLHHNSDGQHYRAEEMHAVRVPSIISITIDFKRQYVKYTLEDQDLTRIVSLGGEHASVDAQHEDLVARQKKGKNCVDGDGLKDIFARIGLAIVVGTRGESRVRILQINENDEDNLSKKYLLSSPLMADWNAAVEAANEDLRLVADGPGTQKIEGVVLKEGIVDDDGSNQEGAQDPREKSGKTRQAAIHPKLREFAALLPPHLANKYCRDEMTLNSFLCIGTPLLEEIASIQKKRREKILAMQEKQGPLHQHGVSPDEQQQEPQGLGENAVSEETSSSALGDPLSDILTFERKRRIWWLRRWLDDDFEIFRFHYYTFMFRRDLGIVDIFAVPNRFFVVDMMAVVVPPVALLPDPYFKNKQTSIMDRNHRRVLRNPQLSENPGDPASGIGPIYYPAKKIHPDFKRSDIFSNVDDQLGGDDRFYKGMLQGLLSSFTVFTPYPDFVGSGVPLAAPRITLGAGASRETNAGTGRGVSPLNNEQQDPQPLPGFTLPVVYTSDSNHATGVLPTGACRGGGGILSTSWNQFTFHDNAPAGYRESIMASLLSHQTFAQ